MRVNSVTMGYNTSTPAANETATKPIGKSGQIGVDTTSFSGVANKAKVSLAAFLLSMLPPSASLVKAADNVGTVATKAADSSALDRISDAATREAAALRKLAEANAAVEASKSKGAAERKAAAEAADVARREAEASRKELEAAQARLQRSTEAAEKSRLELEEAQKRSEAARERALARLARLAQN